MSVTIHEDPDAKVIELTLDGKITREEYDDVADRIQTFIDTHGTIRVVEVVRSIGGFDPSVLWQGLKFDLRNLSHISHVAVVSDLGWISPTAKAAGALMSTRLRTFDLDQLEAARAWVRGCA